MKYRIHEIENIKNSRVYLSQINEIILLTNSEGSARYYGIKVIDYMFKTLKNEFSYKINSIIINVYNDRAALITARELGYKKIIFNNETF